MRQMRKLGVHAEIAPEAEVWQGFLARVDHFYKECDQDRYTFERTLAVCSDEMLALNHQLQEALDQIQLLNQAEREQAEREQAERRVAAERAGFQARLEHAQKMESLGNLAGGVAHDMNNVLGAMLAIASASLEGQPEGSTTRKAFGTIVKAAERGGKMVRGLLGYVRTGPRHLERVDLNAVLEEEAQLLERTTLSKVTLILELQAGLPPVWGDAAALSHTIMNLCVNAVDAMPEAGTLAIRSRNGEPGWVELQIQDSGTGMPREVLDRALEPFYTTKGHGKGTGLGLAMVDATMKAHQGQLVIESEPGRGTLIKLRFPVVAEPAAEAGPVQGGEAGAAGPGTTPGALRVLLVDPDELVLEACSEALGMLGHPTTPAASLEKALRLLEAGLQVDLAILDLPDSGDRRVLANFRALRPDLPLVLVSGRADASVLAFLNGFPQVTLLAKPFTVRQLDAHLEGVRRSRSYA